MEVSCISFILFAAIVTLCLPQGSPGMLCYSCSYTNTNTHMGEECLYAPMNVTTANIVNCNTECYSKVVYLRGSTNRLVNSAVRGCWAEGPFEMYKKCTSSFYEKTCIRVCLGAKCNTWNLYSLDEDREKENITLSSPGPQNCYSASVIAMTIILSFIVSI